ncbi:hypothetical protein E2C06_35855 [Dankookia rubra]|uniref:Uncharacterized protein n=1 Tax=Dankookia rubra TaxID=1442381 RepID=A0A4R5Q4K1_9PROT|nr:hypothetical protein [Dankookia rubra]TDH57606.1 hypothetical protein E2C06_35855 [Dankookia rubra]
MADILLFPAGRASAATPRTDAPQLQAAALAVVSDAKAWPGDDTEDNSGLETVVSLAAAPSESLAVTAAKLEILVARLAPDDGTDTGLCRAETSLLRDVQTFAMDAVYAAQGAYLWALVSATAKLARPIHRVGA